MMTRGYIMALVYVKQTGESITLIGLWHAHTELVDRIGFIL